MGLRPLPGVSVVLRVRGGPGTSPARGALRSGRFSATPPRLARCERDASRATLLDNLLLDISSPLLRLLELMAGDGVQLLQQRLAGMVEDLSVDGTVAYQPGILGQPLEVISHLTGRVTFAATKPRGEHLR